jgi:NADH-quinone oxidoreductase subunit J
MWLALTFMSLAGLFILLNAEFLAIIQILVYVGAIAVVILFGVMLTKRQIMEDEP